MNQPHPKPARTFFWQGVLILLPVAVLAAVGLYSLSQDRLTVRHEATERAQALADELLETVWQKMITPANEPDRSLVSPDPVPFSTNSQTASTPYVDAQVAGLSFETISFYVDSLGRLRSPVPYEANPLPQPLDENQLTPGQRNLWHALQLADSANTSSVIQACREFLKGGPPPRFAAIAHYGLGLALTQAGQRQAARDAFGMVLHQYSDAIGESGLLLAPLVAVKQLELEINDIPLSMTGPLDLLYRQILSHPSPLTRQLIRQVDALAKAHNQTRVGTFLIVMWDRNEMARELFAAARTKYPAPIDNTGTPRLLQSAGPAFPPLMLLRLNPELTIKNKISSVEVDWFVTRGRPTDDGERYICSSKRTVTQFVMDLIARKSASPAHLPDYFGISIDLAGDPLISESNSPIWFELSGGKGGGPHKQAFDPATFHAPVLATAHSAPAGDHQLVVKIHLTNADAMYASQNARIFRFGSLIAVAALAALIGFVSARRAFHRQQHLNEMKDNFVSSVSHELRAPIASVRLMAENLEQGRVSDAPRQNEYYRFIVQECRRLSSLIENVLDFSRIEQGRKQYEFEPTEVVALVRQTIKLMEPVATQAHITLTTTLDEAALNQLPAPQLDGQAMQQALINLIDNAIKHSPKDSIVEVKLESSNQRLRFTVTDHGEGIPAEDHARIFERFYRCGSELRRETQGVGIGLSIVKHIVDAHGGTITVDSTVGQGSRFVIALPLQPGTKRS